MRFGGRRPRRRLRRRLSRRRARHPLLGKRWVRRAARLGFAALAAAGILACNLLYWFVFRDEFDALREKFVVRSLKEDVLTTHMPREIAERAVDEVVTEVQAESGSVRERRAAVRQHVRR